MTRHPLLAILLALQLAAGTILSGPVTAQAQGITVALCSDAGPITVTLDLSGRPVTPHRPCPLCLAARDTGQPPAPAGWTRPATGATATLLPPSEPPSIAPHHPTPSARAPPLPV